MKKNFDLSSTENKIMELLWQLEHPLSLKEITDYLNEKLKKDWKQQTVRTYLLHLEEAELISMDKRFARSFLYFPACTKKEYEQKQLRQLVDKSFSGSIVNLISAFTGGKKLSEEDIKELEKLM